MLVSGAHKAVVARDSNAGANVHQLSMRRRADPSGLRRAAFMAVASGSPRGTSANASRPKMVEVHRSALARQYALLTQLGRPTASLDLATLALVHSHERQRARSMSVQWTKSQRAFWNRCKSLAADQSVTSADLVSWGAHAPDQASVRLFTTSERKDFAGFVTEELVELGLCPVNMTKVGRDVQYNVDFYIGEQFESEHAPGWVPLASSMFKDQASVGSIDGLMTIFGSKDSYAHLFWHCKFLAKRNVSRRVLCPRSWLPSFNVFGNENRKSETFRRNIITKKQVPYLSHLFDLARGATPPTWWIVKPQKGTFLSRGMHLSMLNRADLNSRNALLSWVANNVIEPGCRDRKSETPSIKCDRRMVTFQIYVHKPALFHNRKFDMRLWLLVTSIDPLRLFLLRHGYPKVSSRDFNNSAELIHDQCIHIKMLLDPACNVTLREFVTKFPFGFPRSTASPVFFQGLQFPGLPKQRYTVPATSHRSSSATKAAFRLYKADPNRRRDWPVKEQFWARHVWPAIEASLAKIVMLVRTNLTSAAARNDKKYGRRNHHPFALLSPDLTLDEKGHVYIEEVNTNGLVMGTHGASGGSGNLFFDDNYVKSLLQIVGADGYPRAATYQANLDDAIAKFCNQSANVRQCTPHATAAMARAVHEEAHAGRHFYRLYPPISCFERDKTSSCRDANTRTNVRNWPNQALFTEEEYAAMPESQLDNIVRQFLTTTDTELIHGVPQVPGHSRWQPRQLDGTMAL